MVKLSQQLLLITLAVSMLTSSSWCEEPNPAKPPGGPKGPKGPDAYPPRWMSSLTEAEKQQYKAAQIKADATDPTLAQERQQMQEIRKKAKDDPAARGELKMAQDNFKAKNDAALLKADPTLTPILNKRDAAIKEMKDQKGNAGATPGKPAAPPTPPATPL